MNSSLLLLCEFKSLVAMRNKWYKGKKSICNRCDGTGIMKFYDEKVRGTGQDTCGRCKGDGINRRIVEILKSPAKVISGQCKPQPEKE